MEDFDLMLVKHGVQIYKTKSNLINNAEEGSLRNAKVADWNFSTPERRCKLVIACAKINRIGTKQTTLQVQLQSETTGDLICKSVGESLNTPEGDEPTCSILWPVCDCDRFFILKVKPKKLSGVCKFYGLRLADHVDSLDLKDTLKEYIDKIELEKEKQNPSGNKGEKFKWGQIHPKNSDCINDNDNKVETQVVTSVSTKDPSKLRGEGRCEQLKLKKNSSAALDFPRRKGRSRKKGNPFPDGVSYRHPRLKFYKCHLCTKPVLFTIASEKLIVKHWLKKHKISKPNLCKYCCFIFNEEAKLEKHHNETNHERSCPICFIAFPTKSAFRKHSFTEHYKKLS